MTIQAQLNDLRNQFRGIVSSIRSSGFQKNEASEELALQYWSALKPLLLHARTILQQDQYQDFVEWVSKQEASILNDIRSASKGYEQLSGVANSRPASLETEIIWCTTLLARHKNELAAFRRLAELITQYVLRNEFVAALQCLDELDERFGVSLWSVQLRIALTNEAYGLEAQKKVVEDVRAVFDRGLLGYVAYFCGVRNESRTTAERFSINTEARISRHRYFSKEVKNYLRFILLGESPVSANSLSDLMRVSQSHHFFDLYETCVSVLQNLCMKPTAHTQLIERFIREFEDINDFRVQKLAFAITSDQTANLESIFENQVLNAILEANEPRTLRIAARFTNGSSAPNPWDYIYAGWATSEGILKEPKERRISRRCIRFVAATFTPTQLFDPHDAIVKLARNFGQLPFFQALWSYSRLVNTATFVGPEEHRKIGLNCPTIGFEDLRSEPFLNELAFPDSPSTGNHTSSDFWRAYAGRRTPAR